MAKKEEISKAELYRKERKERLAKEAKKNAKRNAKIAKVKRIAVKTVAIVAAVAVVFGATVAIVNATGSSMFKLTVAKVGDIKVSTSEFQYYYRTSHANLVSQAAQYDQYYGSGYYAQNQGFDYTLLPSEQDFPNEKLDGTIDEEFDTWDDYITYSTLNSIQYFYALAEEAEKAGIELTDDEVQEITDQIEELRETASENSRTLNAYLKASYGSGINEKNLEKWMLRDALAQKYEEIKEEELYNSYSDSDITKEFDENSQDYSYTDIRYYVFNVETAEVEDGASEAEVTKAQEKAVAKAEKEAKAFLKNIKSEKDFIKAAEALDKASADDSTETTSADESTLLEKCEYAAFEQSFGTDDATWAFSESRKAGDKNVFAAEEDGTVAHYYAIYIVKPAYKDTAVLSDLKGYAFTYETDADDDSKAETKEKAQALVDEWNELEDKEKTAEEFSHIIQHVYPDEAETITCTDYADYTDGTISEEVDKWANAKARKAGDVALIETSSGCYVMFYEAKNTEANWKISVRESLRDEAYDSYTEELAASDAYSLDKTGGLMSYNLKVHKKSIKKDVETYLYAVLKSASSSSSYTS